MTSKKKKNAKKDIKEKTKGLRDIKNVRNKDAENVRINQMKAVINACNVGNRILKDFEYDKILKEVSELKNAVLYDADGKEVIEISPEKFDAIDDLDSKISRLEENEWKEA